MTAQHNNLGPRMKTERIQKIAQLSPQSVAKARGSGRLVRATSCSSIGVVGEVSQRLLRCRLASARAYRFLPTELVLVRAGD